MQTYTIHLKNLSDMNQYVMLLERFTFCGHLILEETIMDAYDILQVFHNCTFGILKLCIDSCLPEEKRLIGEYLIRTGLLVTE